MTARLCMAADESLFRHRSPLLPAFVQHDFAGYKRRRLNFEWQGPQTTMPLQETPQLSGSKRTFLPLRQILSTFPPYPSKQPQSLPIPFPRRPFKTASMLLTSYANLKRKYDAPTCIIIVLEKTRHVMRSYQSCRCANPCYLRI